MRYAWRWDQQGYYLRREWCNLNAVEVLSTIFEANLIPETFTLVRPTLQLAQSQLALLFFLLSFLSNLSYVRTDTVRKRNNLIKIESLLHFGDESKLELTRRDVKRGHSLFFSIRCEMSITTIGNEDCRSLGDAMRDLDSKGLLRNDFILVSSGDTISNVNLAHVLEQHKWEKF